MSGPRKKKPPPSEWAFFFAALFAFLTIAAPALFFVWSSWAYSSVLFLLWTIVSALAWLYVLDGYEGEWHQGGV